MFSNQVLSIDIGSYQTKVVVGNYKKGQITLNHAFIIPTPANAIQDGQVVDTLKLKSAIAEGLKEHKIKSKKVIYTLKSTTVITREADLPSLDEEELEHMLKFEVQQFFPTSLDEYVIQHKILKAFKNERKTRLLVAALPKMIIQGYLDLSKSLELKPIALDIHSNCISKLFKQGFKVDTIYDQDHTLAVVDLGFEGINVNIIKDGALEFSRLLPLGGKDLDISIANTLNLTLIESEKKKKEQAFNDPYSDTVKDLIHSSIDGWVEEIQRIFKYHTSRSPGNRIDKIYLMGGHANLRDVSKKIENYFNIPTNEIKHINNILFNLPTKQRELDLKCFLNAVGAIIRK